MSEPIMQWFEAKHLPEHLRLVSEPFGELLEAKDAAVRAKLFKETP